jgi:hypothetical protein
MNILNIFFHIFLFNLFFFFVDTFICDNIILVYHKSIIERKKDYNRLRWYLLHILINIMVTLTTLKGVYLCFDNYTSLSYTEIAEPYTLDWFIGPTSPIPTLIIASGHLYHTLFFNMTKSDIYHHLIFAANMTIINMMGNYGIARNLVGFVLSGLPGIIEYSIMSLYKFDYLIKKNMRYLVTIMHCLLRFPISMMIAYNYTYQVLYNPLVSNPILVYIITLLLVINATQYCFENIKSSIKHYHKN